MIPPCPHRVSSAGSHLCYSPRKMDAARSPAQGIVGRTSCYREFVAESKSAQGGEAKMYTKACDVACVVQLISSSGTSLSPSSRVRCASGKRTFVLFVLFVISWSLEGVYSRPLSQSRVSGFAWLLAECNSCSTSRICLVQQSRWS